MSNLMKIKHLAQSEDFCKNFKITFRIDLCFLCLMYVVVVGNYTAFIDSNMMW